MVWKQDLAKLKQQLVSETPPPAPKPPPKVAPMPSSGPIEEEDAVFLAAMGLKPAAPRKQPRVAEPEPVQAAKPEPPPPETFQAALRDLKGFKPLAKDLPQRAQAAKLPPQLSAAPEVPPVPLPTPQALLPEAPQAHAESVPVLPSQPRPPIPSPTRPAPPKPAQATTSQPTAPVQFQLAAGMALEVDATLDLRGHSLADAMERLKDRLGDAQLLGWRILQVTLGSDPMLHEGLLALIASGEVALVTRYAQAPIPMGGNQAWLLYLGT